MSRFTRVLLINPAFSNSHYKGANLVTGLGYISEALSVVGVPNTVVDMQTGYSLPKLKGRINQFDPDIIGISMMSFSFRHQYNFIKTIKQWFPEVAIVCGGPHISTIRERALKDCPQIDYGITLEGEETIVELCRGNTPLSDIKGLLYRDAAHNIRYTGDRSFIKRLDSIAFPTYSQFELSKYPAHINIVSSRGCPYHCIYCPVHLTIGREFRIRSAQSVVEELAYWYVKGYKSFGIADDNFTSNPQRVFEICDEIDRRGLNELSLVCANGLRADKVNRKLLKRMKEVGFGSIAFGVEAGNNKILRRLKKGETIETIEEAIKNACDLGYKVTLFFLIGSPDETEMDVRESVDLALKYPVVDVRFYNLIPFPNTELFKWVDENDYFVKDPNNYLNDASHWINSPIFETPEMPVDKRKELYAWANTTTKLHTRKNNQRHQALKLRRMGCPAWASKPLADVYLSQVFQKVFVETGLIQKAKNAFSFK